ncbi:MAG: GNAT family N-acetyltransferase [Burkholderiales bacterium]|nr:GNAT family N-acetyltransferase [Burkholderiales bacterium]
MIEVKPYNANLINEWNLFIQTAKNTHFMFNRGYMGYHSHRFKDFSLMFYSKNKLIAVLPANITNEELYSHQGLTFGGLILASNIQAIQVIHCFEACIAYLRNQNLKKIHYKCIPYIYHQMPSDEDKYALFLNGFHLVRRDLSSSVLLNNRLNYTESRKGPLRKARNNELLIIELLDFSEFWILLENVLSGSHNAKPVHSAAEIQQLRNSFPENIRLFVTVNKDGQILAGAVVYVSYPVIHLQYLASSADGRMVGALDLVIDHILHMHIAECTIVDFGISNENSGRYLNEGLIAQKEGFGARGIAHDFYELAL